MVILTDVGNLTNETSARGAINTNFDVIEAAFENTLSRDGSTPNELQADIDMNGNQILNLPAPTAPTDPVRLSDLQDAIETGGGGGGGGGGSGDFVGPASSTDNALVRFNSTGGKTGQNSTIIASDDGDLTGVLSLLLADGGLSQVLYISETESSTHEGLWILANATFNRTTNQFNRVDTTKTAYAVNFRVKTNIPFESNTTGVCFWRCTSGSNPILDTYGTGGGWEAQFVITQYRDIVLGGLGMEVDGSGQLPYARFVNTILTAAEHRGLLTNLYNDFSGVDDAAEPSWFAGTVGDKFVVKRAAAGAGSTFDAFDFFTVDSNGAVTFGRKWNLLGTITPAQITANVNNYDPVSSIDGTPMSKTCRLRLNADAPRDITGLAGGDPGRIMILYNFGASAITLKHANGGSTGGNQFLLPGGTDVVIPQYGSAIMYYDSHLTRWTRMGAW